MTEGFFPRPAPRLRQETRNPQSPPDGGDSPLFKGAWTIRLTAPGPFVGALPRPARILHPAPGPRRSEALLRWAQRRTIPARGRQQAGESPFDSVRRMERHPPSSHHERRFSRALVLERVFGYFLRAEKVPRPQAKQQYRPQGRGIPAEEGPAPAVTPAGLSCPGDSLWSHHNNRPS